MSSLELALSLLYFILGCVASYLVFRDQTKKAKDVWHPGKRSLGPVRWAAIVFITGGLAIGIYWFVVYHEAFLRLVEEQRKDSNERYRKENGA